MAASLQYRCNQHPRSRTIWCNIHNTHLRSKQADKLCTMHIGHMIVIVLVNGSYVYATLNGLSQKVLFVIQFFLGCFKLAWSSIVIPKVVSFIFGADDGLVHTVYMTLFSFIGGPFISTCLGMCMVVLPEE
jgi:hypothetical protein